MPFCSTKILINLKKYYNSFLSNFDVMLRRTDWLTEKWNALNGLFCRNIFEKKFTMKNYEITIEFIFLKYRKLVSEKIIIQSIYRCRLCTQWNDFVTFEHYYKDYVCILLNCTGLSLSNDRLWFFSLSLPSSVVNLRLSIEDYWMFKKQKENESFWGIQNLLSANA